MTSIQIKATKVVEVCLDDKTMELDETSLQEAEYISLYRGEPGDYRWIADFSVHELDTAKKLARYLALLEGHEFLDHIIY